MHLSDLAFVAVAFCSLSLGACGKDAGEAPPPLSPDAAKPSPPTGGDASFPPAPGGPTDGGFVPVVTPDAGTVLTATLVASPIVSRGKRTTTSSGNGAFLVDGSYFDFNMWQPQNPTPAAPQWVAIEIGVGPSRLLVNWVSALNGGYNVTREGAPGDYRIETSANSTNGADGAWTTAVTITGSRVDARLGSLDFTGQKWVRLTVLAAAPDSGGKVQLNEIDVHDASKGVSDTWIFVGDSITAGAMSRGGKEMSFPGLVHKAKSTFYPAFINAGTGGTNTEDAVRNIDDWIRVNPDTKFWAICYGTNDASGDSTGAGAAKYEANLRIVLGKLRAAGRVAVMPRIPFSTGGATVLSRYNAVVDKLRAELQLPVGPDLFAHFQANQNQLYDGVHPNEKGSDEINRLWSVAMLPLYP